MSVNNTNAYSFKSASSRLSNHKIYGSDKYTANYKIYGNTIDNMSTNISLPSISTVVGKNKLRIPPDKKPSKLMIKYLT